jgi:hypothetical protein
MEHTILVWNTQVKVAVHQNSKTVWIAVGEYMGERIEVKARTESQALAHWREAARYRGG